MRKAIVILPTYNEALTIRRMTEAVFQHLPHAQVLIVDDGSPDGTGEIADQLTRTQRGKVFVLHRKKKEGLGKAYLHAFHHVLAMNVDAIVQMDCDFSHPPEALPRLTKALDRFDFALGSRYVKGGGTKNWPFKRKLISRAGNLYARLVLNSPIQDLTGGFKAFRRKVIEHLVNRPIDSQGYNFQIEISTRALAAGFTCTEVPFVFVEREIGVSKMHQGIIWEALLKTFRLRRSLKQAEKAQLTNSSAQEILSP